MKTLSIDIETYSDQPLNKTGVYRYVETPVFEILLFSYSVDSGPVQLVDLPAEKKFQQKSSQHWKMIPLPNGPTTPALNASVSLVSWAIPPEHILIRNPGDAPWFGRRPSDCRCH